MLKFHCHKCGESFRIAIPSLFNRTHIVCQSCTHAIPVAAVEALRAMSEAYMDVVDVLKREGDHLNCWSLSIDADETLIPKPVGAYDHLGTSLSDGGKESSYWGHRNPPLESKWEKTDDSDLPF